MFSFQALFVYLQLHGRAENEMNQELTRDWKLSKWGGGSLARALHRAGLSTSAQLERLTDFCFLPLHINSSTYRFHRSRHFTPHAASQQQSWAKQHLSPTTEPPLTKTDRHGLSQKEYLQPTFNQEQESSQVGFSSLLKKHLNHYQ